MDEEWQLFFSGFDLAYRPSGPVASERAADQSKVASLIFAYRNIGHLIADLDPLGDNLESHPLLELETFGLTEEHLDQVYRHRPPRRGAAGHAAGDPRGAAGHLLPHGGRRVPPHPGYGGEAMAAGRDGAGSQPARPDAARKSTASSAQLIDAELFESFTHGRYQGQKRFSLEGAEALIPALHQFMETAAATGAEEVVMGMAHRGRLNVLANILRKPYSMIFHEFEDNVRPDPYGGDGDVKYHRGYSSDYATVDGQTVHVSLTANPSHLEAVDPVVEGRTRAKQRRRGDSAHRIKVLPLLIHGDAAFAGQGLVAETFNLSQLKGYNTGGTVHIVVNNQIGFTTLPGESRSTRYPTDIAKFVDAPVFHVNGDDPEAVVHVIDLALRYRQQFGSRRRRGHRVLPQTRPQRGRRTGLHPTPDVPEDPKPAVDPVDLPAAARSSPRHHPRRERETHQLSAGTGWSKLSRAPKNRVPGRR